MPDKPDGRKGERTYKQMEAAQRLGQLNKDLAAERKRKRAEALGEPPAATALMDYPEPVGIDEDPPEVAQAASATPDTTLADLAQLFASAATDSVNKMARLRDIERVLGGLSTGDYADLAKNPAVQAFIDSMAAQTAEMHPDDPPGTIYGRGTLGEHKRPWQWRDLPKYFPAPPAPEREPGDIETVEITPNESLIITWNGLPWPLRADIQQWIPRPHYDVYMERRRQLAAAAQHRDMIFGNLKVVTADPTIVSVDTGRVRGHGQGVFIPGAGGWDQTDAASES